MSSTPSKATAGPWVAAKPGDYSDFDGDSIVILGDEKRIAVVHGKDREAKANASLIAAAPDLLAALCEAREFIDGQIDVVDGSYREPAPNRAMILAQEIDAAIAKAEGGS